jgi:hypothetical protein
MLQTQPVSEKTLELIVSLQQLPELSSFVLVGGTALALQIGHRTSIDIDLFSTESFDVEEITELLVSNFGFQILSQQKNTLRGIISGVMTDIITHPYPFIEIVHENGIRMASRKDIAAMILNAISVSGERFKDFVDIYFLLDFFSLSEMIEFYNTKYSQKGSLHVIRSLIYFNDINESDKPAFIQQKNLTLSKIKKRILQSVQDFGL